MKIYTTGQISKICKVAPRTVSKWCDSGALKHYLIPATEVRVQGLHRRVTEEDLFAFMRKHGMDALIPGNSWERKVSV